MCWEFGCVLIKHLYMFYAITANWYKLLWQHNISSFTAYIFFEFSFSLFVRLMSLLCIYLANVDWNSVGGKILKREVVWSRIEFCCMVRDIFMYEWVMVVLSSKLVFVFMFALYPYFTSKLRKCSARSIYSHFFINNINVNIKPTKSQIYHFNL